MNGWNDCTPGDQTAPWVLLVGHDARGVATHREKGANSWVREAQRWFGTRLTAATGATLVTNELMSTNIRGNPPPGSVPAESSLVLGLAGQRRLRSRVCALEVATVAYRAQTLSRPGDEKPGGLRGLPKRGIGVVLEIQTCSSASGCCSRNCLPPNASISCEASNPA